MCFFFVLFVFFVVNALDLIVGLPA